MATDRFTDADFKPNGKVDIWDLGPQRPIAPDIPVEPKKTGRAVDDAIAMQLHEDAVEDYKKKLKEYSAAKREYDHHRDFIGGPIKVELWDVDANAAMDIEPARWVKTLPAGLKPGHAHAEAEERRAADARETAKLKDRDPHMGRQQAASP